MKSLFFILITFLSSLSHAVDLTIISKACKSEKKQSNFCEQLINVEQKTAKMGENIVKTLNMEAPLAVGVFLSDPKYTISFQNHGITVRPESISYSFAMDF